MQNILTVIWKIEVNVISRFTFIALNSILTYSWIYFMKVFNVFPNIERILRKKSFFTRDRKTSHENGHFHTKALNFRETFSIENLHENEIRARPDFNSWSHFRSVHKNILIENVYSPPGAVNFDFEFARNCSSISVIILD